jgi:hypothetical protein
MSINNSKELYIKMLSNVRQRTEHMRPRGRGCHGRGPATAADTVTRLPPRRRNDQLGSTPMKPILGFAVWGAMTAITLTAAIGSAHAAAIPYDGSWYVIITTVRGACSSGSGFSLQIQDGAVYGSGGGYNVGGRVSRSGAVQVSVSSGQQHASGSGRLRGNSGGGSWHGVGSEGSCTGYWSASRE